ncbi:MAG: hypothetical protein K8R41_06005 [Bacteroidales bacterium]|nr:hypothetical protein [Bacteroidales bacterium]
MKKIGFAIIIILVFGMSGFSQNKYSFAGHLENLETLWITDFNGSWQTMNTINNRFDLKWYPNNNITAHIGMRNIFNYGQIIQTYYPVYANAMEKDFGFFDLTENIINDSSCFLYTNIDRLNFEYISGKFEVKIGRQRINWSTNLVWTPNDIFNSFSYFDFDYIEHAGCDAVKLQYYTGMTSSVQFAAKINHNDKVTIAGMYRFNKWNYDFQFLGGVMDDDIVAGCGFSGQIEGAGINGEMSYFRSKENFMDSTATFLVSIGSNYTFKNSLYIHTAFLVNTAGTTGSAGMGDFFTLNAKINAKNLTNARCSIFGEISYPITPLLKLDVSSIYNPNDKSVFLGPSLDLSLMNDLGLLFMGQLFWGDKGTEFGDYGKMFFLRLKYSF